MTPAEDITTTHLLYAAATIGVSLLVLLTVGLRDVLRFRPGRVTAVGGVVFREGLRRRVLWVTPLGMIAVLAMISLTVPVDELDAVRQATKFCLLASGAVSLLVAGVLSTSNLPREIESKVIFTVVTKPVTRLELLLGKLAGFACVTGVLLLIMGTFSWVLLTATDWRMRGQIRSTLQTELPVEGRRPYLQYLADTGLARAQRVERAVDVQIYGIGPTDVSERQDAFAGPRWMKAGPYYTAVPFALSQERYFRHVDDHGPDLVLAAQVRTDWRVAPWRGVLTGDLPLGIANLDNLPPPLPPAVQIDVMDDLLFSVVSRSAIVGNAFRTARDLDTPWDDVPGVTLSPGQTSRVFERSQTGPIHVSVFGLDGDFVYGVAADSVRLVLLDGAGEFVDAFIPDVAGEPRARILFRTYLGSFGLGVSGPEEDAPPPTAVFAFRNAPDPRGRGSDADFELTLALDRLGAITDDAVGTRVRVRVVNVDTGAASGEIDVFPETGRPTHFSVPRSAVAGGNFDVELQTLTRGHVAEIRGAGLDYVVARNPFVLNLVKGLFVQWLLTILVAACGIAFSTAVSWPVAVALVVVVLGGRWVSGQVGDLLEGGSFSRQVAADLAGGDAATGEVIVTGVEGLNRLFLAVSRVLPDTAAFGVAGVVERGQMLEWSRVWLATGVLLVYGLPATVLGYLIFRNREVAP